MDAGLHDRAIDLGDDAQRFVVLARYDLGDGLEAVLLVARIDALRRIADGEIRPAAQPRGALKQRRAFLFDGARINGRFVDHDVAALERAADRSGRGEDRTEIGTARRIDRGRNGDDVEIRRRQCRRIVGIDQRRMRQVRLFHFARAVDAGAQFLDPFAVDVETDHRGAGSRKGDRHRQADIAEPDYGNLALMRHQNES